LGRYPVKNLSVEELNEALKWMYYSAYHPSWNVARVLSDYKAGVSLKDVVLTDEDRFPGVSGFEFIPKTRKELKRG